MNHESASSNPMTNHGLKFRSGTVTNAVFVIQHILIYGAEKCVNSGYGISKFIESLTEFNTVLMAQKQSGAMAIFQRIQGGMC